MRTTCVLILLAGLIAALPATAEPPAVCFAPDTPHWYAEGVSRGVAEAGLSLSAAGLAPRFQLNPRWTTTATDGGGLAQGQPITLTWSYIPDGTAMPCQLCPQVAESSNASNLFAWLNGIYGNFATWHALFVQIFDRWSELTGIQYVYQPTDDASTMFTTAGALGTRGDLRIGAHLIDGNSGVLAYNFYPDGGDMVIDSGDNFFNNTANNSLGMRNVLAHEHGHGIGIRHVCPVSQSKLMEPFVSFAFDGPQHDDILAANRHYGDRFEDNDTSGTATGLGAIDVTPASLTNLSADDESDLDYYSFTVAGALALDATVTPTGFTYLQAAQNANGSCPAGTSFNSLTLSDLSLDVLDTDGSTLLTGVDATAAGGTESVTGLQLPGPGTYFLRVSGSTLNAVQLYSLSASTSALLFADGFETGTVLAWTVCEGSGCPP
jgi:hypothetical protein